MRFAKEDIGAAERMLKDRSFVSRQICFLAQQGAEKALKACLVFLGVEFPKTHDLARLWSMFPKDWNLGPSGDDLDGLAQWAVEPRYPGEFPAATLAEAAEVVAKARALLEAIERELARHG